ncbi:MAG TPA: FAD-dependent oxidoreductase [Thermoplasmata archaeon]|nr:FAD-dependent oxidoreductase [Thermoplasmata archaeon]
MDDAKYVIVGGGLAGFNAIPAIRERDPDGRIVLLTDERERPYDRVPLSKRYLQGALSRDGVFLRPSEFYAENHVELIAGQKATALDADAKSVTLDDGRGLRYERLLLATGGAPRRLPLPGADLSGIHYLRTLEDSDALKEAMGQAKRLVVVGGGFIGCEVAAAGVLKGLHTTVIEVGPYLLNMAFDEPTGRWVMDYATAKGIKARCGERAARFIGHGGRLTAVETATGAAIPADLAVVGVGLVPNMDLAKAAGLQVDNGIVVNERLETTAPGVYAAGDVARFYSPVFERHLRVEHYDVAVRHGKVAGANMAGAGVAFMDLPYFFSDMFELKIHVHGILSDHDRVVLRGERKLTDQGGFIQFYLKGPRIMAYLGVNRKLKEERAAQKLIASRRAFQDTRPLEDSNVDLAALAG